ncbi:lipoprotein [Liquorilactobacillus mali KCTC 3596 = DSM 20444]|uniref:Lipoprotein n=2 Tax=Liquorilactobacillus mali TaxID=1618 RepID=A0A0R2E2T2_9LACO|nr:lipoprotein [Liquorilactobacillus mali KCTC 3596 = DSM 20444]
MKFGGIIMKKGKKSILLLVLLSAGLLTACGNQKQASSSSKKISSEQTSVEKSSNSSQKSSSKKSSASVAKSSSSVKNAISSSTSSSSDSSVASTNRLSTFNQQLRKALGTVILPTVDGLGTGSDKLNVRYEGNQANYTISYSVGSVARQFNDTAITSEIPYVQLKKTSYSTSSEASAQVDYVSQDDLQGLPTIDLGHNITGYEDAGAGQRYLSWHEGKWSLMVHAAAVNQQNPKPLATNIVNMLESYRLPAPTQYGAIRADVASSYGSRNQVITWQQNNVVYQLSAHDITTAIKMAASMK